MSTTVSALLEVMERVREIEIPDDGREYTKGKIDAIAVVISALEIWQADVEKKEREENIKRMEELELEEEIKKEEEEKAKVKALELKEEKTPSEDKDGFDLTYELLIEEYIGTHPEKMKEVDEGGEHFCARIQKRLSPGSI